MPIERIEPIRFPLLDTMPESDMMQQTSSKPVDQSEAADRPRKSQVIQPEPPFLVGAGSSR
jgi:hypothetical protein